MACELQSEEKKIETAQISVARIEERVNFLISEFGTLKTNDLAHVEKSIGEINQRMDGIEKKIAFYMGAIAVIVFIITKLI